MAYANGYNASLRFLAFFFVLVDAAKNVTITSYGAQSGGLENTVNNTQVSTVFNHSVSYLHEVLVQTELPDHEGFCGCFSRCWHRRHGAGPSRYVEMELFTFALICACVRVEYSFCHAPRLTHTCTVAKCPP